MSKVLDFLKTRTVSFYLFIISAIFSFIAVGIAVVSCSAPNGAYKILNQELMVALSIIGSLIIIATVALSSIYGEKLWISILPFIATILLGCTIIILFTGKIDLMGTIWFSELDRGNKVAEEALNLGVVSLVMYVISMITLDIGFCFRLSKDKEQTINPIE